MRYFICFALLAIPALAPAADLAAMNRTIAKEPAYAGKPQYCLLVFGAEAKHRVWLVQDGNALYVDRNGRNRDRDLSQLAISLQERTSQLL